MIKKYAYVIGIDTGVDTGVATWNVAARKFELIKTTAIHKAMMYVKQMYDTYGGSILVRVEDPRLRKWFNPTTKVGMRREKCCKVSALLNGMLTFGMIFLKIPAFPTK